MELSRLCWHFNNVFCSKTVWNNKKALVQKIKPEKGYGFIIFLVLHLIEQYIPNSVRVTNGAGVKNVLILTKMLRTKL